MSPTPKDDLRAWLLELYARYVSNPVQPPDQFLGGFLRRHGGIRGRARNFLGAVFYSQLRRRAATLLLGGWDGTPSAEGHLLSAIHRPEVESVHALLHWMVEDLALAPEQAMETLRVALRVAGSRAGDGRTGPLEWCETLAEDGKQFLLSTAIGAGAVRPELADPLRAALPPVLWRRWEARFGRGRALELARAMGQTAPLDIRVNTAVVERRRVLEVLHAAQVPAGPLPHSPAGIRLGRKVNLSAVEGLEEGWWEVQDEGSQLICLACGGGGRVLDACAGAGGKALAVASLPDAEVFAHDTDGERLARLVPRAERAIRAGGRPVTILPPGEAARAAPYDVVLVDAPCLGLGRMRRDPTACWRRPLEPMLAEVRKTQRECLGAYGPLVRPGGVLVYATCSFEPEETVEALASLDGFDPDPLAPPLEGEAFTETRSADGSQVLLLPSLHGTDGFFIARLRRKT